MGPKDRFSLAARDWPWKCDPSCLYYAVQWHSHLLWACCPCWASWQQLVLCSAQDWAATASQGRCVKDSWCCFPQQHPGDIPNYSQEEYGSQGGYGSGGGDEAFLGVRKQLTPESWPSGTAEVISWGPSGRSWTLPFLWRKLSSCLHLLSREPNRCSIGEWKTIMGFIWLWNLGLWQTIAWWGCWSTESCFTEWKDGTPRRSTGSRLCDLRPVHQSLLVSGPSSVQYKSQQ